MEYSQLQRLLKSSNPTEIYSELMGKEEHVLDTINRVVNQSNEKEIKGTEFLNLSLLEITQKLFWNMQLTLHELYEVRTFQDLKKVFLKDDRKIYIGIVLVLISMFLFFIMIST